MSEVKRCVFCGGADHPAECGYTEEELAALTDFGVLRWLRSLLRRRTA